MNTRPFDLEAAKRGEAICKADGDAMTFIAHAPKARKLQRVLSHSTEGEVYGHFESGAHAFDQPLCMVVKTKTVWVNLYDETGAWTVIGTRFVSEESAKARVIDDWAINGRKFLGTVSIQEAA